jgi:hypothetical protein
LSLAARVEDPLPDRRPALVCWLPCHATRVDGRFLVVCAVATPHAGLVAHAGHGALGLLHSRQLDEGLRLAVQVARLGRQRLGHGPKQCRGCSELLAGSGWRMWVVDVEVIIDVC